MNLTPGTGKSENLISRYQTHQLHQDLIRHFGSLEDGLIAMLDQKGDPYTLVRDFAIIDVSEKDQPGTMTVVMHLLSGAMNFFEHDWLDITELIDNIDEADPG